VEGGCEKIGASQTGKGTTSSPADADAKKETGFSRWGPWPVPVKMRWGCCYAAVSMPERAGGWFARITPFAL